MVWLLMCRTELCTQVLPLLATCFLGRAGELKSPISASSDNFQEEAAWDRCCLTVPTCSCTASAQGSSLRCALLQAGHTHHQWSIWLVLPGAADRPFCSPLCNVGHVGAHRAICLPPKEGMQSLAQEVKGAESRKKGVTRIGQDLF